MKLSICPYEALSVRRDYLERKESCFPRFWGYIEISIKSQNVWHFPLSNWIVCSLPAPQQEEEDDVDLAAILNTEPSKSEQDLDTEPLKSVQSKPEQGVNSDQSKPEESGLFFIGKIIS